MILTSVVTVVQEAKLNISEFGDFGGKETSFVNDFGGATQRCLASESGKRMVAKGKSKEQCQ